MSPDPKALFFLALVYHVFGVAILVIVGAYHLGAQRKLNVFWNFWRLALQPNRNAPWVNKTGLIVNVGVASVWLFVLVVWLTEAEWSRVIGP